MKYFLSLIFILFQYVGNSQIDQDGQTLIGVSLECNNLDQAQFEQDIEGVLANFIFTDNNSGACNGNVSYVLNSFIINSGFPYTCGVEIEVELDLNCDVFVENIVVTIALDDNSTPYDFTHGNVFGNLIDPNNSNINQCDQASLQADFDAWWMDIEMNGLNGSEFFEDACADSLTIISLNQTSIDFGLCMDSSVAPLTAVFDVEDECGNIQTFIYSYNVTDDEAPLLTGVIPPSLFECNSIITDGDIDAWIQDILNNGPSGNDYFDDACQDESLTPLDITLISGDPRPIDFTSCPAGIYEIEFEVSDQCGNVTVENFEFELEDTTPSTLDLSALTQTSILECDGTSAFWLQVQSDVETLILTHAVIADNCNDYNNLPLNINDFIITPNLSTLDHNDLTVNGGFPCLSIEFEITWLEPCTGNSLPAFFTYEINDNTGPIDNPSDPWPSVYVHHGCPDDPIDWPNFTLIDNCGENEIVDGNDFVTRVTPATCTFSGTADFAFEDNCGNQTTHSITWEADQSQNPFTTNGTTENIEFGIVLPECNRITCFDFTEANGNWHDDPVNITTTFSGFPRLGIDFQGGCPPYEIFISHVPAEGMQPLFDPNISYGGAMQCVELNDPTDVTWELIDDCGGAILVQFEVHIECSTSILDNDNDGSPASEDCDDNNPNNFPGNPEICDGLDNNCNGIVDEGFFTEVPVVSCFPTDSSITVRWLPIIDVSDYHVYLDDVFVDITVDQVYTINNLSANQNYTITIEANSINGCPSSRTDIVCSTLLPFIDNDNDGSPSTEDCDDNNPNNFPGNPELCDGEDNNCNGQIDEGLSFVTYFTDNDMDGFGEDNTGLVACEQPPGTTTESGDCDDTDHDINPSASEIPNNTVDENCDGIAEIIDLDGDGWNSDLDCDDTNGAINPGATEVPGNGIDEDCDGVDQPSAVHEIAGQTINIFPNPVADRLYIETDIPSLIYTLFSADGSLVQSGKLSSGVMEMVGLVSGIYVLKLGQADGQGYVLERILKN